MLGVSRQQEGDTQQSVVESQGVGLNDDEAMVKRRYEQEGWEMVRSGWPDFLAVRQERGKVVVKAVEVKHRFSGRSRITELNPAQKKIQDVFKSLGLEYVIERPLANEQINRENTPNDNVAIFDSHAPDRILAATENDVDWCLAWFMLNEGMHPEQIRRLKPDNFAANGMLMWKRVKNKQPMSSIIPPQDLPRLREFIEKFHKKPLTRETIWSRIVKLNARAGYWGGPRVLRKTFILNELRRRPREFEFVALRAGCSESVVKEHYLLLDQWNRVHEK